MKRRTWLGTIFASLTAWLFGRSARGAVASNTAAVAELSEGMTGFRSIQPFAMPRVLDPNGIPSTMRALDVDVSAFLTPAVRTKLMDLWQLTALARGVAVSAIGVTLRMWFASHIGVEGAYAVQVSTAAARFPDSRIDLDRTHALRRWTTATDVREGNPPIGVLHASVDRVLDGMLGAAALRASRAGLDGHPLVDAHVRTAATFGANGSVSNGTMVGDAELVSHMHDGLSLPREV